LLCVAAVVTDLADLFSGFGFELVDTSFGRIFVRMGAQRPPLLVLYGYPRTHAAWHRVRRTLLSAFYWSSPICLDTTHPMRPSAVACTGFIRAHPAQRPRCATIDFPSASREVSFASAWKSY
jgi:hypothetical protein